MNRMDRLFALVVRLQSRKRLRAVGWAPDGVVEAVEGEDERFVVGVQWHAESLVDAPEQGRMLEAFVAAAAGLGAGGRVEAAA